MQETRQRARYVRCIQERDLQAFCIPIGGRDDPDAESPNMSSQDAPPEPAKGGNDGHPTSRGRSRLRG
jgi:hypothetical protein